MFAEVKKLNKRIAARLAIAAAVASGMVVAMMFIAVTRPKHTQFCAKCHNDISFTNACKKSSPGDIACIECHTHGNAGITVMAVEIRDEHCTAESCHPVGKLSAKTVQYKKITPFRHKTHTGKLASNLKLRCTSCHANINGEKHFEMDVTTCNTCHFINTMKPLYTQDNRPISDCSLCHGHIETIKDIYGKAFKHEVYETNEKVRCSHCHFETIQGNGRVDKKNCYRCHSEIADNFKSAPDMHHIHIEDHKIACTLCHESVTHGWDRPGNVDDGGNSGLHAVTADYKVQELIMMGMGGVGIKGEPDPMYIATLHCSACHKEKQRYANVDPNICNNCHEKGFDRILAEQMRFVTSQMRLLRSLLIKAKRRQDVNTNQVIYEAETNYNLVREDGSLGAHNIKYVKYLLDYSITNLKQIVMHSEN